MEYSDSYENIGSVHGKTACHFTNGFTLWEKVYAQVTFNVMAIVGVVGIALVNWPWAIPYAGLYLYGIPGIVMRHLTCPRCRHLSEFEDCLQFPPKWTARLLIGQKSEPMSVTGKVVFLSIFALLPLYPIYWMLSRPELLVVFVISATMWYAGQLLYFCKHCRVQDCPFNRVEHPAGH